MAARLVSSFWLVSASLALSLAWVLPNHSIPWTTFHSDAWVALMTCIPAVFILVGRKFEIDWHWLPIAAGTLAIMPMLQHAQGVVPLFGIAWVNSVYLIGFTLALLTGAAWEQECAHECADYLFLALGIASFVSVGLQIHQFFVLEPFGPWIMYSNGTRHSANLAQPNQLGSLLMLGLLSVGWGFYRKFLGRLFALVAAGLILLGVALTESRTAWLNISMLLTFAFIWRRTLPSRRFLWAMAGLTIFFVGLVLLLPSVYDLVWFENSAKLRTDSPMRDARWAIWGMFLNVAFSEPVWGFGWGQLHQAQLMLPEEIRNQSGLYTSAHNLFLDLIIWSGFPVGLAISGFLVGWFFVVVRRIGTFEQVAMFAFVSVLGIHAMLEFPLHYAYFLLPAGLMMGCLNTSLRLPVVIHSQKILAAGVFAFGIFALSTTIRDYFRVETSMYGLRFEQKKIETTIPLRPPDVLALTHWYDYMVFARLEPRAGVSGAELEKMEALVTSMPGSLVMYKMAVTMAYNNRPAQAQEWLKRNCMYTDTEQCEKIRLQWSGLASVDPRIAAIPWPFKEK
jgi:Virulence factor membrane-bound polymerase, C-terminal/O-Antigen ligase